MIYRRTTSLGQTLNDGVKVMIASNHSKIHVHTNGSSQTLCDLRNTYEIIQIVDSYQGRVLEEAELSGLDSRPT